MKLKDTVVESIKWLFVAQIISQVVRTAVTILVMRSFDAREMALVALAGTVIGFFEMFSTLGLGAAIISKKDVTKFDLQNVFGLVLLLNVMLALLVFGGAELFAKFYDAPEVADILKISSIYFVLTAVG